MMTQPKLLGHSDKEIGGLYANDAIGNRHHDDTVLG